MTARILFIVLPLLSIGVVPDVSLAGRIELEEVAHFSTQQVTGVAVSKTGRVFVNFPDWSDAHTTSVAEIIDGQLVPYPSADWNARQGNPAARWVCVQSVVVDSDDALWVLDPASPKTEGVVKGGPKLVKMNLATNQPVQTIRFDDSVAPERSYLNDVRIDNASQHAFITESGVGSLVVVDLKTGASRRVLAGHPSTKVEIGVEIIVDGMKVIDPKTGLAPNFNADGIALDQKGGWLYYHPLGGVTMYRIKIVDLLDEKLDEHQLASRIENLGTTPKPDGMLEAPDGSVFLTVIEKNGIARFDAKTRQTTLLISDERLQWPDTMAWGPEGKLYVTTSQIHRMPKYNAGVSKQKGPFAVYRLKLP